MKKLLYIPAILLLAACSPKPTDKKAELADLKKQQADITAKITALQAQIGTTDSAKGASVSTIVLKPGMFTNYVQIQGKIDAQDNVTAYPQANAVITAIYVKVGDHVSKGQTLAQLDNSVLVQSIAQTQAQATLNNTLFQRQKNLWDQKIGTEVQYLQAKASMDATQKQVESLRKQADMYRIVSPISGTVDQMDLKLGQVAAPGAQGAGIRVVNADVLKVKADVPESYSSSVNQGDSVKVMIPDVNDSLVTRISFAAKVIDPNSRSFGVEIKLPQNKEFRPNMTAVLKIADYSKRNVIAIPLNSIQKSDEGDYVYVNVNGYAKRKNIVEGSTSNGMTEIKSGLSAGDELVTEGASEIGDGDKINVLAPVN